MTALIEVAAHLAPEAVPIADMAPRLRLSDRDLALFHRYFGLKEVRLAPDADLRDQIVSAARELAGLKGNEDRVSYVVSARTIPLCARASENPVHAAVDELGLSHAQVFTVTQQACASGLAAVDLAGRLLAEDGDPDALALVLTGEKALWHRSQMLPGTTVMGESSAACLVSARGSGDVLRSYVTRTYGEYYNVDLPAPHGEEFERQYPHMLTSVIREAVDAAGIELEDLAWILPHNVNRISWARAAKLLGYPRSRIYLDNVPLLGHSFCADPFVNFAGLRDSAQLRTGDFYLTAVVGLGATFAAAVFRH
ncbi:3-oxoacyl-[acyl-carrier-protein] synthase III C-terminal domain-containing protein [Streptomyces sp. NPDC051940]|uniref:3-oxoacyl-[acyl-carrier-protein] synthase III C-terminal domain-containing protein n=1 Tax=Streptomyces sp. NPDC051940 TaxID=3155675 RepID=UPI0034246259